VIKGMEWLPQELRSFVGSAEEVFSQLGGTQALADICTYHIYSDVCDDLLQGLADFVAVEKFVASRVGDYMWYRDSFRLSVVVPPSLTEKEGGVFYYHGTMRYGDCVDDEWFIVYLLLELTKEMPHLSCRITDSDGDFLLIEAAEHLPAGLNPDNSANRVWIRSGKVHIIPLDEPGKSSCGGMRLKNALECLRIPQSQPVLVSDRVQSCIRARTLDVYPAYIDAMRHTAVCTVPRQVAYLLQHERSAHHLLPSIVNAFCSLADSSIGGLSKEKGRHLSSLARFGTLVDDKEEGCHDFVAIPVRFTRPLYARLCFEPFSVPSCLHSFHRHATEKMQSEFSRLDSSSGGGRRLSSQSAELGCKILCGLELAYQRSLRLRTDERSEDSSDGERVLSLLTSLGLRPDYVPQSPAVSGPGVPNSCHGVPLLKIRLAEGITAAAAAANDAAYASILIDELLAEFSLKSRPCSDDVDGAALPVGDDESWLHLTPDELDAEMLSRVKGIKLGDGGVLGSQGGNGDNDNGEKALPAPLKDLQKAAKEKVDQSKGDMQRIVDGMQKFMSDESGLQGIKTKRDFPEIQRPSGVSVGGLDVNLVRLEVFLGKLANSESALAERSGSDSDDDDDDDDDDEDNEDEDEDEDEDVSEHGKEGDERIYGEFRHSSCATSGRAIFSLPTFAARGNSAVNEAADSDDEASEAAESEGISDEDFDDDEYQAAMLDELMQTTLKESLLLAGDGQDVDIERNLLASLLESHASEMGNSGPASILLSHLGVKLEQP